MKSVSGKEFCKILERRGWRLWHVRGSHHIYEHPNRPGRIPVPVHGGRSLKTGLQRQLMKRAGLTDADL